MYAKCRSFEVRAACVIFLLSAVSACATAPHLASIVPTGGERGTELQLSFSGDRLQDTDEIICYEPGIEFKHFTQVTNNAVKALVKIKPDCGLGEHHLRLRTASGISELRTFFVGPYPVVAEIEPNNTPAKAQKISLNTTIAGVITSEDVDCFAVTVKKGERLSAEVEGMRLGRGMFDPRLALLDTNGTVLADVADTWLGMQDPFISLVTPHDGVYLIQLREAIYGGNNDCHYRLHVGNFPRPTSVYPLGGKAGEKLALMFYSQATGEFMQDFTLPETSREKFGVFAEQDHLPAPTPNWIRVSPFPNFLSPGPSPDREHAAQVGFAPPFALNGIISMKGEEDWYRFPASKGTQLELNVYARQLRSPLDSVIEVFDAKGRSLAANDDAGGADSALKFTPEETTNYFVRIRDTFGRFGRDFTYRLEIVPAAPEITVKIPEVARNDTQSRQFISVPRGNRFATLISAKRANLKSELRFELPGLPFGVNFFSATMPPNVEAEPLVFEAAPDAPIGGKLLDLAAIGTNASGSVTGHFQQVAELVEGPNNTIYCGARVDKLCVAVVKEAPFHLRIVEPQVPLVQAGSMALEIVAERKTGFDEPIELQMIWNPPGVSSQTDASIAKGATNVFYQLNAGDNADVGNWKIAVLGHATVEGGQVYVSTQLSPLEVSPPFIAGKIQTLATSPGKAATLNVELEQLKPFKGKAKIRLLGLPEKVTAPDKEISAEDKKIAFNLSVATNCPPGSFKNLFCSVDVPDEGKLIPHHIAAGGILRIVPAKRDSAEIKQVKK